jgi:SAM-dependent methyltransferase
VLERHGRVMTSDSRILDGRPLKVRCSGCGLVRSGLPVGAEDLEAHYRDYVLASQASVSEPIFFTRDGPVLRSAAIADWIRTSVSAARSAAPRSVLEIGCGEGSVLARLADAWPGCGASGLDLSPAAVPLARSRGLDVAEGDYAAARGSHDVVAAFAVLEHVGSPRDFLRTLRGVLSPHGVIVVAQPNLEGSSSDLFFVDHLHHFRPEHTAALAAGEGLRELVRATDHPLLAGFALHVFAAADPVDVPVAPHQEELEAVRFWADVFARLDAWLERVGARRLAVWGLGQTFMLLSAYTRLGDVSIALGIDDNPARFADARFPVADAEGLAGLGPDDALIVTFPPSATLRARLAETDAEYHLAV